MIYEPDKEYYEIAKKRLQNAIKQSKLPKQQKLLDL